MEELQQSFWALRKELDGGSHAIAEISPVQESYIVRKVREFVDAHLSEAMVIRLIIIWKNCLWPAFESPETNGKKLIRNKSFYKGRLLGRYWRVVVEATGFKSEK